jgi:hypothetical protein
MNIKKALKTKNKLVKTANEQFAKVSAYNSMEDGANRPYSAKEMLNNWIQTTDDLVELKTKIHIANAPVYGKIFRLAELKSMVSRLNGLDCTEGKSTRGRWGSEESPIIKVVEIPIIERDILIKAFEFEIEKIQDELDTHNAITEI